MAAKRPRDGSMTEPTSYLSRLLGMPASDFFSNVWEQKVLSRKAGQDSAKVIASLPTWENLLSVLEDCAGNGTAADAIVLKDQHPDGSYRSLAAAYLDGCSIVVNHADLGATSLADLCRHLRSDLPHAFANMYLTPPKAQAVDAHADDRDVIVLQCAGRKRWSVWSDSPIVRPLPHEQVGKAGLAVPETVLAQPPKRFDLGIGDVLYIPRGFVHEVTPISSPEATHQPTSLHSIRLGDP